jgi:hypothetical protein
MLVIEREGYGRLEWLEPVDVTGLDLQDLVQIDRGECSFTWKERGGGVEGVSIFWVSVKGFLGGSG